MLFLNKIPANIAALMPILIAVLCIVVPVIILAIVVLVKMIIKSKKRSKLVEEAASSDYEDLFGGHANIKDIQVNMSRVIVEVKNLDLVKLDDLKAKNMGVLISGNVVKCANQDFANMVAASLKNQK